MCLVRGVSVKSVLPNLYNKQTPRQPPIIQDGRHLCRPSPPAAGKQPKQKRYLTNTRRGNSFPLLLSSHNPCHHLVPPPILCAVISLYQDHPLQSHPITVCQHGERSQPTPVNMQREHKAYYDCPANLTSATIE